MARIAGVDLPKNKRDEIGLTYIFGIGRTTATKILKDPYRAAMHTIIPSATDDDEVLAEVIGAFENFFIKKSSKKIIF